MTEHSLAHLLAEYVREACDLYAALKEGNVRKSNKSEIRLQTLAARVRAFGDEGKRAIAALMEHESVHVRFRASLDMLGTETDRAVKILEEIASSDVGLVSLDAQMLLDDWYAGNWKPTFD